MGTGDSGDFNEVLEQVLGFKNITRDKFFEILETMRKKRLSTHEFFKLLEIIAHQEQALS